MNVWSTISQGAPSPRKELLLNIDLKSNIENHDDLSTLTVYEGIAFRAGDMKLLMSVPNASWHKPPELGEELDIRQHKVHVGYMKYLFVTVTPCITNSSFYSEAGGDRILVLTAMSFLCKCELVSVRKQ